MEISLPPNTKLQNKYTIKHSLGEGGFGITYLAEFLSPENKVAIKEFFPNGCVRSNGQSVSLTTRVGVEDYELAKRKFQEEAYGLSRLNHKGVVRVRDVFEENNTVYYVMEFIARPRNFEKEGSITRQNSMTLRDMVEEKGIISEEELLYFGLQLSDALIAIHNANILHLDVKPDNVMVSAEEVTVVSLDNLHKRQYQLVLIDFGTSKILDQKSTNATLNRFAFFSKYYSAPELTTGLYWPNDVNKDQNQIIESFKNKDVYSLGATLYYLLTGSNPGERMDREKLIAPRDIAQGISNKTNQIILKALAWKPEERYKNVELFKKAIIESILSLEKSKTILNSSQPSVIEKKNKRAVDDERKVFPIKNYLIVGGLTILIVLIVFGIGFMSKGILPEISSDKTQEITSMIENGNLDGATKVIQEMIGKYPKSKWLLEREQFCKLVANGNMLITEGKNLKEKNQNENAKKKFAKAREVYKEAELLKIPSSINFKQVLVDIIDLELSVSN